MDRLTSTQLSDLLDFLRAGYACLDQEAFVTHLLSGIPTLVPSEVTTYNVIDPKNGKLVDATVEPVSASFPEAARIFEQHIAEHPLITHYQQTCDGRPLKISDFLSRSQFHRLALYQEFFRQVHVEDQMVLLLTSPTSFEIGIGLNRSRRNFSERERLLLNLLRPHLIQAYQNALAVTGMQHEGRLLRQAMEASGQEVVVLNREGRVRLMTPRAHRWLAAYFGQTRTEQLPEALRAWVSDQAAVLGRTDDAPPPREPLRVEREGACLLVRHLCEAEQCLLLLEERQAADAPVAFAQNGLTRREAEVLQWVAQGKTNGEIGYILNISPRTVDKHLQHIYEKLGVETRMAAATLALGWRSEG